MTENITGNARVGEIAARHPTTRRTLERLEIDYCCGGNRTLSEAAAEKEMDVGRLLSALREAAASDEEREERDWTQASMTELVNHIKRTHHSYMKQELPRLDRLLARVQDAHSEKHAQMLGRVRQVFAGLKMEIEMHLMKEEQVLFPYLRQVEAYRDGEGAAPQLHCVSVRNPVTQMKQEHENAAHALERMREITRDYDLPEDACESFRALYEGLEELEDDLHQHIHLENNILFPAALKLEAATLSM